MRGVYFSIASILLYYLIGLFCAFWIKVIRSKKYDYNNTIMFGVLWLVLTLLAGLRYVNGHGIGGSDAGTYEYMFLNPNANRLTDLEGLFVTYTQVIAFFTTNPYIYRFISYGIIAMGYCIILSRFYDSPKMTVIPYILIIFPYLRSFNTMRTSLAIAIFLVGLVLLYERKNFWGIIFLFATVFIHRMSALYVLFLPFYYIFRNFNFTTNRRIFIFLAIYAIIGYVLALQAQKYVLLLGAVSEHDAQYLTQSLDTSIIQRIPLIFQHVLLMIALCFWNNKLPDTHAVKFIRLCVIFDIIIIPVSVVFGMWRAVEYMYIARLIMWSYIIYAICQSFVPSSQKIVKACAFTAFSVWLLFRIYQEWAPAGLTPYIFISI